MKKGKADKLIKHICNFCDSEIESSFFGLNCNCEGFLKRKEEMVQELQSNLEKSSKEEYDLKYPVTFQSERLIKEKDSIHKLKLEARKFQSGEGLSVWIPFPHKKFEDSPEEMQEGSALVWDFTKADAKGLYSMLGEYLEGSKGESSD